MGQSTIEILIEGAVMKRCSSSSALRLTAILLLSASLLIKSIQFALIVYLSNSQGMSVESLAVSVTTVFGGGANESISGDHLLGSFEADRGLRVFSFIYVCVWLTVSGLALIGLILNRLMLIMLVNLVVSMLGVCVESFLTVTLASESELICSFFSYFPLLVDCITNITLIIYCCWLTKNGMSFNPQEYHMDEEEEKEIRGGRKHNTSTSSTFRRFESVDG
jgi:hypothetical protein